MKTNHYYEVFTETLSENFFLTFCFTVGVAILLLMVVTVLTIMIGPAAVLLILFLVCFTAVGIGFYRNLKNYK